MVLYDITCRSSFTNVELFVDALHQNYGSTATLPLLLLGTHNAVQQHATTHPLTTRHDTHLCERAQLGRSETWRSGGG